MTAVDPIGWKGVSRGTAACCLRHLDEARVIRLPEVAVDLEVVVERRPLVGQIRCLRQDRRHNLREVGVVELDRVAPERPRGELVDERDLRAVPDLVLRDELHLGDLTEVVGDREDREPILLPSAGSGKPGKNHDPAETPSLVDDSPTR
jgi:hypothetical protein